MRLKYQRHGVRVPSWVAQRNGSRPVFGVHPTERQSLACIVDESEFLTLSVGREAIISILGEQSIRGSSVFFPHVVGPQQSMRQFM